MNKRLRFKITAILVLVFFFLRTIEAYPLPQVDEVVSGDAQIQYPDSNTMQIDASANTIINYTSFDINEGESVIITLPSYDSEILNRVIGNDASELLGNLSCNGIFILINNSGIYVGPNANIDAASLILSTRDIQNADFLNKDYFFKKLTPQELDMLLVNKGRINIQDGGFGVLIAGAVENQGTIIAPIGKVVLATGDAVRLDISNGGLISVVIEEKAASAIKDFSGNPITDQIKNTGTIQADGGMVILDAESLPGIFEKAINLDGYVRANKVLERDGIVKIIGDNEIAITGNIEAESVELQGLGRTYLYGDKTFNNFSCTVPDKEIYFEPNRTYTFKGIVNIIGAPDIGPEEYYIKLRSQEEGVQWFLDMLTQDYTLERVNIRDCYALNPIMIPIGVDAGNNFYLIIDPVWDGDAAADDYNWSSPNNWDGNVVPAGSEAVNFDITSSKNCTIDDVTKGGAGQNQTWSGGTILIGNAYGGTITLSVDNFTTGNFSILGGTFTSGSNDIIINGNFVQGGGIFNAPSTTMSISGNFGHASGGIFNNNNGTVILTATDTDNLITTTLLDSFFGLTFDGSGGAWDLNSALTVTDALTITDGTFDLNGKTLTVTGAAFSNLGTLRLQGGETVTGLTMMDTDSGTIEYDGPGTYTSLKLGNNYYNLTISGSGSFTDADNLDLNGSFTQSAGTFTAPSQMNIGDSFTHSGGDFTHNSGTVIFDATDTDNTINSGGSAFYRLTFDGSGGAWDLDSNALTVTNALNIDNGTFDLAGQNLTATDATFSNLGTLRLQGGETITGLTMDTDSGTIEYDGPGTYTSLKLGNNYYNLTISGSGSFTDADNLDLNGSFAQSAGIFTAPSGNLNIARNFTHSGGNFTHNLGTVIFDGSGTSTITGNTTFNDFSCATASKVLNVNQGDTLTVGGTFTLNGGSELTRIDLNSTGGAGTTWNLVLNGDHSVQYVDVQGSNASGTASFPINPIGSEDSGDNTNWFPAGGEEGGGTPPDVTPELPRPPQPPAPPEPPKPRKDGKGKGGIDIPDKPVNPGKPEKPEKPGKPEKPEEPVKEKEVAKEREEKDYFVYWEEEEKIYKRRYRSGKYRTVVIVLEGEVVSAPYDEEGPRWEEGITLSAGERISQEEEVE